MAVATEDVEVKPAVVTGASPSGATETTAAKESTKAEEFGKDSEEEKEKPEDKNSPLYERTKKYQRQRDEARDTLGKLKTFGIESPEHAEFLQREAQRIETVENQLATDPKAYEADLLKEFPNAHAEIIDIGMKRELAADPIAFEKRLYQLDSSAHHVMVGNAVARVLLSQARAIKGDSPDIAGVLEALASEASRAQPQKREAARTDQARTESGPIAERVTLYHEQVDLEVHKELVGKIDTVLTDRNVEFKNERQKKAVVTAVLTRLEGVLNADNAFVKELDRIDDPRNGLTKSQRKASVDHWMKFANLNGRLQSAIYEEIEDRNIATGKPKELPNERREINGAGRLSTDGAVGKSESDRIYEEQRAKGLRGADLKAAWMAAKRALRGGH